jgi:hypothetical protein
MDLFCASPRGDEPLLPVVKTELRSALEESNGTRLIENTDPIKSCINRHQERRSSLPSTWRCAAA